MAHTPGLATELENGRYICLECIYRNLEPFLGNSICLLRRIGEKTYRGACRLLLAGRRDYAHGNQHCREILEFTGFFLTWYPDGELAVCIRVGGIEGNVIRAAAIPPQATLTAHKARDTALAQRGSVVFHGTTCSYKRICLK